MQRLDVFSFATLQRTVSKRALFHALCALALLVGVYSPNVSRAQSVPSVSFPVVVSPDTGSAQSLTLGVDPAATGSLDQTFQEAERPPLPPSSVFDARLIDDEVGASEFGEGSLVDIRFGDTPFVGQKTHRIQVQPGPADSLTFTWTLPSGVSGTIEGAPGGEVYGPVAMEDRGSLTVGADAPDALVSVEYSGEQQRVNVQSDLVYPDSLRSFTNTGVALNISGLSAPSMVTVKRYGNGPEDTSGIPESNVSDYRYVIEPQSPLEFNSAKVRLAVRSLPGIGELSDIDIYKRPDSTRTWSELPTSVNDAGTPSDLSDDVLAVPVISFSEFVLASNTEPLPVELTNFTAQVRGNRSALLTWRTASETKNAGFDVEHRAPDGDVWTELGFVESKATGATATEAKTYRFTAEDLSPGTHQFRLRQVDADGSTVLSDPVTVELRMDQALRLTAPTPNPTGGAASVSFAVRKAQETRLHLYNTLGQRVRVLYEGTPTAGQSRTVQLDAAGLPSGVYFVRLQVEGRTEARRLTVVR